MRDACAYMTGSVETCSKLGMRITVVSRVALRLPSLTSGTGAGAAVASPVEHAASARSGSIAYGSGSGASLPGASSDVESSSLKPASGRAWAVPRSSPISSIGVPAASRCATSTRARSALPKSSRSAFASTSTLRRTLSDQ